LPEERRFQPTRGEVAGVVSLLCRHDEVHIEAIGVQRSCHRHGYRAVCP
jgi:hypothetical protein